MLDEKLTHPKLHEVVADRLTRMIIEREILPGEHLPPERELTERLGVSRGVVREATKLLVAKGLVTVRSGAGATVVENNTEQIVASLNLFLSRQRSGIEDVLELRQCLETEAAELAARRASQEEVKVLDDLTQQMEQAIGKEDAFILADLAFHRQIAVMSRNTLFIAILDALSDVLLVSRHTSIQVENGMRRAQDAHQLIFQAIAARNSMAARQQMQSHIAQTRRDIASAQQQQTDTVG